MKVFALLLAALVAVQAVPIPGSVNMSYDEVNGQVQASKSVADKDGLRDVQEFKGNVADINPPNPEDVRLPQQSNPNPDGEAKTETSSGSVTRTSSSSSSTTDKDGNTKTSGSSKDYSSDINNIKNIDENGVVTGETSRNVSDKAANTEGLNGVEKTSNYELNAGDKHSQDEFGNLDKEVHYNLNSDD